MPEAGEPAAGDSEDEALKKGRELLRRYETGPWPSHVSEIKKTKYPIEAYARGLANGQSEWHGGAAKVRYVYTGFIARRTKDGKSTELHFRVYQPSGQFYTTKALRGLLDFADEYGLGLIETTGQTGGMIISMKPELADPAVDKLRTLKTDIGNTGDTFRDFPSCVGPALCEYALYDSLAARDHYMTYPPIYENLGNQMFPFKVKLKFSACPMDCSRAVHRSDFGFVGVWEGAPEVDQTLLKTKAEGKEVDVPGIVRGCPSKAIQWDEAKEELRIDGDRCQKSMNCIRRAFPAIAPGKKRKVALLAGGNSKGRFGPKMAKPVTLLDDYRDAKDFVLKIIDEWAETSPHKDRIGDMLTKTGFSKVMDGAKDTLPGKSVQGHAVGQTRIVNSAVLSDDERKEYAEWAEGVAREFDA
ncbi:MAG: sulfite reductase, dissimilatory-type subunit alpha [Nitrososphaerota archaeon]|nr:sulfite reductase, dissimilatory-type subunit alpha [Nitrososphaerota archaeon]